MGMSPFLGEGLAGRWRAKNCQRQRPRTPANGAKKVTKMRCAKGGPAPRAVCLALRAQSHRWDYCVERLPSLLQHTEGRPQLRVAPQGRLLTRTTSQRPHREDRGDLHPNAVQHAAQSYCQVRPLIFCSRRGPQESSSLKQQRDSGTFAPACLRRGSVQHASRGYGPGVCWRPSGQVASRPATTSQTGPPVGQPAHFAGQAPPGNGGKRATQQQTQQF